MGLAHGLETRHGWSGHTSPDKALREILRRERVDREALGIVFASDRYDSHDLAEAVRRHFAGPVLACTTAGELATGEGYVDSGISAAVVSGVDVTLAAISDADEFGDHEALELAARLGADDRGDGSGVVLTLFDGLCMREEWLSSMIYEATGGVPMVGGSAGDGLRFERTGVLVDGAFRSGGGVCALVRAPSGFRTFIGHHYADTGSRLVVTDAEPSRRLIRELNGKPAAAAYAEALGVSGEELTTDLELRHPLMMVMGERIYVRGVQQILEDGSMRLFCAIQEGLVLHVGEAGDLGGSFADVFESACVGFDPGLIVAFDCVTRRLEATQVGTSRDVRDAVSAYPMIGFSTFGEQFNGMHVNQTVTGVVFGEERG